MSPLASLKSPSQRDRHGDAGGAVSGEDQPRRRRRGIAGTEQLQGSERLVGVAAGDAEAIGIGSQFAAGAKRSVKVQLWPEPYSTAAAVIGNDGKWRLHRIEDVDPQTAFTGVSHGY